MSVSSLLEAFCDGGGCGEPGALGGGLEGVVADGSVDQGGVVGDADHGPYVWGERFRDPLGFVFGAFECVTAHAAFGVGGFGDDDDGVAGQYGVVPAAGFEGLEGQAGRFGTVFDGCHRDDELVGVVNHAPPVRGAGGVAGVHDDEPVVPGQYLMGDIHFFGGHFVVAFVVFVRAQDVELVRGLVVDETGDLGCLGAGGEQCLG